MAKGKAGDKKGDIEAKERQRALSDYDQRLADVMKVKEMTDTEAWGQFYRAIQEEVGAHAREVLVAEKTRDVIRHQEGVKILRGLVAMVKGPVDELNRFITNMPLFAQHMKVRAEWNAALGKVELKSLSR